MSALKERASALLQDWKGATYAFGSGALDDAPGQIRRGIRQEGPVRRPCVVRLVFPHPGADS